MDSTRTTDLNRVTDLSEVYEALDSCVELERALGRLARVDVEGDKGWATSKAQVRGICAQVEQRLEEDT